MKLEVRDAQSSDFQYMRDLFTEIHQMSAYSHVPFEWDHMLRMFSMSCAMPNMFCQVVVKDDEEYVGVFAGLVGPNIWGAPAATDTLAYSRYKTEVLIKNYVNWAKGQRVKIINITDLTGRERYQRLIEKCGFSQIGTVYNFEVD